MIQNDVYIEKLAAVMQGGAFNFPFHVGGIKACEKRGVWPDYIEAVSAGSLAGIFWAMKKTDELYALYDQLVIQGHTMIWKSDFISENKGKITVNVEAIMKYLGLKPNIGTGFKLLTQKNKVFAQVGSKLRELPSLADNTPLFEILKQFVTRAAVQIPYRCRFVCFDTGEAVSVGPEDFDDDTEFCKAIWASATMPGFWKLVDSIRLKGDKVYRNCGDGGVRDNSPIMSAKRWIDLDETPNHRWGLIAWNCNNDFLKELYGPLNLFDTVGRTFGIFMNEMGKGDFETFEVVNEIAEANGGTVKGKNKSYKYYNYAKIEPYENELGSSLSTDPDALRNRLRLGRKHTEAYFAAQKD